MKTLIVILNLALSFNSFAAENLTKGDANVKLAGGSEGGSAGGSDEEKVKIPTKLHESSEELELGRSCLTSISPDYDFKDKQITSEFLRKEISTKLTNSNKRVGRSIASIPNNSDKSFDCHIFAKIQKDPQFIDLIAPTTQRDEPTNTEAPPVSGSSR